MFSKQAVSYLAFLMVVLVATSSAVQTIAELQLIEGSEAQNSNNTAKLLLHRDVLQGDAYRDIPCHVVSVCGKQGVMKSTLLRALSIFFDMAYGALHTNNLGIATTTSVDISDVSRDNHILIDIIGNDDPSFAMPYGLDPLAVDRAFSQLVAPAANVLIYPIKQKICGSDLESLAMYADHAKYQVGQLQKNLGVKPTLIIVIRTSALYCTVNLKPQMCEPEEYLRQSINLDHPMWSSFSRIELVQIPELHGADWEKIQPSNFRPREVPQFWDAIETIGTIVNDNKQAELSLYWTGGQLGRMFEMMLPMINDDIGVDPPSVRRSLITSNAQSDAQQMAAPLDALMQACVEEPFRGCDSYGEQLSKARKEAEVNVLLKYDMHKAETKMYAAIQQTVAEVFNKKEKEIKSKVESRKQAIQGHLQSVYESARTSLSNTEQSLSNVLSGDAVEVDSVLVNSLNGTLQQYHAALDKWTLPEQSAKSCYDKLKKVALLIWTSAHEINNAKHINRMHNLRSQALPPVEFDYINSHNTPSFEHTHVREDLGKKYSDYFSDQALQSIISIDADFNAGSAGAGSTKTGGYGRLVLEGQNKEYVICQHADSNFRGHGNYLSYNPVTKELHAWTYGWGFRGGKHTNRNWMSGVKFTVTSNALSAKPEHYALPYVKGTTPDMFLL